MRLLLDALQAICLIAAIICIVWSLIIGSKMLWYIAGGLGLFVFIKAGIEVEQDRKKRDQAIDDLLRRLGYTRDYWL